MRVLITGAGGHVGGAVTRHLTSLGWQAVALHRSAPESPGRLEVRIADLGDPADVERLLADCAPCQAIVHAAARISPDPFDPDLSRTNGAGTQQVFRLAAAWKAESVVYLSSLGVVGQPRQRPVTEEHPVDPPTTYHATKLYGERLAELARRRGLPVTTFRLTSPVGPGMPGGRILSVFVERALAGEPLRLLGQGKRRQDYVDVRDAAVAVELALRQRANGLFNLASGAAVSNLELAEACVRELGSASPIVFAGEPDPEEGLCWEVSADKAARELGYRPAVSLAESIKSIAQDLGTP